MQQLSRADAQMLQIESPQTPNHVAAIWTYDARTAPNGRVAFQDVLSTVESRLHLARAFRQRLVQVPFGLDEPWWVEDSRFDLEFHVRQIALPRGADWHQLWVQLARLFARPLDLSRPPWELYVIEDLNGLDGLPEGAFATILKVHHAAVDGQSGLEMTTALHDHEPAVQVTPPGTAWAPDSEPSSLGMLARAATGAAFRPVEMARLAARLVPAAVRLSAALRRNQLTLAPLTVPATRFNGRVTPHRVLEGRSFALDELRTIRKVAPGLTVNDVAMAMVSGGLRSYLLARNELPEAPLVAMMPISTRAGVDKAGGGNEFAMVPTSLCTDVADPLERLVAIHDATSSSKALVEAVGARTLGDISTLLPGALFGLVMRAQTTLEAATGRRVAFNTTVTNVPGSREPLYFCGARAVHAYGAGPFPQNSGLIHIVSSYVDAASISITADRDMLPDPGFYAQCLESALHDLSVVAS